MDAWKRQSGSLIVEERREEERTTSGLEKTRNTHIKPPWMSDALAKRQKFLS